jgi:2-polyprenyl-3-methyl-5-hydroxy-6-metoxy-1,4-benzoquinol methylase
MHSSALELFSSIFLKEAAIFKKNFWKVQEEFGTPWQVEFDLHLRRLFGFDEDAYRGAIRGYTKFALDAMRLQQRFNRTRKYEDLSYEEACEKVYLNGDYMLSLYLPGVFVSQFLWRHHYRQFLFHKERFLPLLDRNSDKRFYEVGTGTGFYTVQMFRHDSRCRGYGIDISPSSRRFTQQHADNWGFGANLSLRDVDILTTALEPLPCVQTVEVLEHLGDPQAFLHAVRKLLAPGGHAFIAAAMTAPEVDHIHLYWSSEDIIAQLHQAGFAVEEYVENHAYEGAPGDYVPRLAAFIVS